MIVKEPFQPFVYIGDYHPYRIEGVRNPHFDARSGRLLDIKNPEESNWANAVLSLGVELLDFLPKLLTEGELTYMCVVPSHEADKMSVALMSMVEVADGKFPNLAGSHGLLRRTRTIPKLAKGGSREIDNHMGSIVVTDPALVRGARIIVFDDVATTGNSLEACRRLLLNCGAKEVTKLVLGKTTWP